MKNKKASNRFRKQLKDQLPVLCADGLISAEQSQAISQRYQLDNLAKESTSKLLMAVYLIGVFLIGVGVISFVAFHWKAMSKGLKIALIFSAMLASHTSGFYLWKISGKSPKLGHALIFLGTLIFGANIGLMAQIFHIKSQWNSGFLPWAIGAIVMAYVVGSVPNAALAIITSLIWFFGQLQWLGGGELWWYPFTVVVLFTGFAYFRQSVLIFVMALFCLAVSLPICLTVDEGGAFGATAAMLVNGLLFFCWGLLSQGGRNYKTFAIPAIVLGVISTVIALYLSTFLEFADGMVSNLPEFSGIEPYAMITGVVASATAIILTPFAIKQIRDNPAFKMLTGSMALSLILITAACFINDITVAVIANALFLALAALLVWNARFFEDRRMFWSGVLLTAILVVSRAIEYETGLMIKSAVFTACGIGVIVAGVMFEKFLKSGGTADE